MDPQITHNHPQLKKNVPELRAGDRVRVHQKIQEGGKSRIQVFEGLIIKTQHGRGINGSFTVRRISLGIGVEKCFPLHMPAIAKIEKLKSTKVRRAKLYYIRGLIGKAAKRLKKEKENKEVWEDVVVVEDDKSKNEEVKDQNAAVGRSARAEPADSPSDSPIDKKIEEETRAEEKTGEKSKSAEKVPASEEVGEKKTDVKKDDPIKSGEAGA